MSLSLYFDKVHRAKMRSKSTTTLFQICFPKVTTKIFNIIVWLYPSVSTANFEWLSNILSVFLLPKTAIQRCSENFVNFPEKQRDGVPDYLCCTLRPAILRKVNSVICFFRGALRLFFFLWGGGELTSSYPEAVARRCSTK